MCFRDLNCGELGNHESFLNALQICGHCQFHNNSADVLFWVVMSNDNCSHFPTRMFVRVRRVTMAVALAYTTPFTCGGWGVGGWLGGCRG